MTTKKTARKPKTFWAVLEGPPDGDGSVRVFAGKPIEVESTWGFHDWQYRGLGGGDLCYLDFLRITGIKLESETPTQLTITVRKV